MLERSGVVICSWPKGRRAPRVPVPYAQETMHGFEYAFGTALIQSGWLDEGVEVFRSVRDRYDGKARNPWNEIECGSNYARSMASWAGLLAMSGFGFDAHRSEMSFAPKVRDGLSFRSFWSNATAWGLIEMANGSFSVTVLHGEAQLERLGLPLDGGSPQVAINGRAIDSRLEDGVLVFKSVRLARGDIVRVSCPSISVESLRDVSTL